MPDLNLRASPRPKIAIPSVRITPIRSARAQSVNVSWPHDTEVETAPERPEPFEDYRRSLTDQGGVLIFYKDLDLRLRQYAWRVVTWTAFTSAEGFYLAYHAPISSRWVGFAWLLAAGIANWLIIRQPSECHRWLEIRPDCVIIEGVDVFWRRYMDAGPPAFQEDEEGNQRLCAIYGTRLVELLIVRRFDELDRTPEVIAAHLEAAFEQVWPGSG